MAKAHDFRDVQGDDIHLTVAIQEDGVAVDITGGSIWITFKNNLTDVDTSAVLQVAWGAAAGARGPLTSPASGIHEIHLTNTDTANLNSEYYYDIQYKSTAGDVITLLIGKWDFTHERTVTKS
mgnify:CR=1 FL=1